MTNEEKETLQRTKELIKANYEAQKKASDDEFKKKSLFQALNAAQSLGIPANSEAPDLTDRADTIYQWLIKDL